MPMRRREFVLAVPAVMLGLAGYSMAKAKKPMDPLLKARIKGITNVFEVGKAEADYVYVEDLNDGRGYTVTNYGFVTREREVAQVIAHFAAKVPTTELKAFIPHLPPRGKGVDTSSLKEFPAAWMSAAKGSVEMADACESVADRLYFNPAMKAAEEFKLTSALGRAIVYDTILQHGDGNDPDSLRGIYKKTMAAIDGVTTINEIDLLYAFLEVRRDVLQHATDKSTALAWSKSVTRVDALQNILAENPALESPVRVRNSETDIRVV
jgi:chitosanase